ncbi:MAG: M60 family metallopeptidase [Clostridia bacterium]|nr:M60 family metallopeptidase [Clostridia bacterium]
MAEKNNKAKTAKRLNFRIIAILALSLIFVVCLSVGVGCSKPEEDSVPTATFVPSQHKNKTQVGYSGAIVGTTERYKPVDGVHDEGLSSKGYPKYGSTLNITNEEKTVIIQESRKLTANGTWVDSSKRTSGTYDKMDKDGYLYKSDGSKPDSGVPQRLYKHTASVGLYRGDVADNEQAVVKKLTLRPRSYSSYYSVTGLYAPAGEVIKIQLTDADMKATGGITIHIGQALYNGQANNIWEQRAVNRMPVILNTMNITESTATYDETTGLWTGYVGSFLGGPIYVRDESSTFSVTISGGVNYAHFILGVTTEEEYAAYSKSSAPYFDLEVWDRGVLHSGPKKFAQKYSYNDLYKAATLWEKISLVTTSVSNQGIVFIYDPFVAAGAAVAFPGRRSVNCPEGWMTDSLNYNGIVTSGSWGNFHEYHHNFQDYGVGDTGEVTNNGLNLVSYSLFTKISSARQIAGFGGSGLSGWNQYTSATWALQRVNNGAIRGTDGLAVYATLLHNLGQDAYIKTRGAWGSNYYDKWANYTHQDMTYYANLVSSYGGNYSPSQAVKNANYPLFVPVSSVYQTGRTYNYDGTKREINTMQPFVIPHGKAFNVDLNPYTVNAANQYESGSVVIAKDFKYSVKSVKTDGINGSFVESAEKGIYTFTPNEEMNSGKIRVTLEITTKDGAHEWNGHKLEDVDLILEFQQTHETNKSVLERTTYIYTADTAYTDAREAYEKGYAGYESKNERDHSNPTQNCNTDIWYCTESSISRFPNANPELDIVKPYSIDEVRGKLYFPEAGIYNIYMRGRKNCALYYSVDGGKTYQLGIYIADNETTANWRTDKFVKLELAAESWVYFKEVLINEKINDNMTSFIGLGIGQWQMPMYTPKLDANGNQVLDANGKPLYVDANGKEVSAEVASDSSFKEPTSISYATAYRQAYEFNKEFESDYFYTRSYGYDYKDNVWVNKTQTLVTDQCKYTAPPAGWGWGNFPIGNLVDGNKNTFIHTSGGVSESNPLVLAVDMGEVKSVNRMIIYSQYRPNGDWKVAKSFTLQGSLDGTEYFDVASFVDVPRDGANVTVNFESKEFRYYKLTVTQSYNTHIIIGEIEMWNVNEINGATMYSPDDAKFTYNGTWQIVGTNSSYGHVYLANSGAEVSFEVQSEGDSSRVGILTSNKYGQNYEVYVDGKKVDTIKLKDDSNECALRYLTPVLSQGKHSVTIKFTGEANIDSIVIYP